MGKPATFPINRLKPVGGTIAKSGDGFLIAIEIAPFFYEYDHPQSEDADNKEQLISDYKAEIVDQSINFAELLVEAATIEDLAGREFTFPLNPETGYYEGSLYIWDVYNPVDVLSVRFGAVKDGGIEAEFSMYFRFSFEGLCDDVQTQMAVELRQRSINARRSIAIPFALASDFDSRAKSLLIGLHPLVGWRWRQLDPSLFPPALGAHLAEIGSQLQTPMLYSADHKFIGFALFKEGDEFIGLSIEAMTQYIALLQDIVGLPDFANRVSISWAGQELLTCLQEQYTSQKTVSFAARLCRSRK